MADGLPTGVDGNILWCIEPTDIPRLSPNTKDRSKRLKTLGNAVVPAQVYLNLKIYRGHGNREMFGMVRLGKRRWQTMKQYKSSD
ncbi:MAG: hypothetical protein ACLROG_01810, partial [Coprococcus phoceensis]